METETVTREQFDALPSRGGKRLPETVKALALAVDIGERFKNHPHKVIVRGGGPNSACNLQQTIKMTAKRAGMKMGTRHDGPDLIVFRLK